MKRLNILYLLLFIGSFEALSQDCLNQASKFGESIYREVAKISDECKDHTLESGLKASSMKRNIEVFAYENMIYIKKNDQVNIISGKMSLLEKIELVSISPDEKFIAVLNSQKDSKRSVLVFPTNRNGNISPLSINSEIPNDGKISFIKFSTDSTEILFSHKSNSNENKIFSFSSKADSRSPMKQLKPIAKVLGSLESNQTVISTLKVQDSILVLSEDGKLTGRAIASENVSNDWEINLKDEHVNEPVDIFYSEEDKELIVLGKTGEVIKFSL